MIVLSQKLIFQAERIVNPASNFILGKSRFSCSNAIPYQRGKGLFNVVVVDTHFRYLKISHIFSSINYNTSEISKQLIPNCEIGIFCLPENNLSIFEDFSTEDIENSNLKFNDEILLKDSLLNKSFNTSNYSKTPTNLISFDCISDPTHENDNELLFFPYRLTNNKPSILNSLQHVYSYSFSSNLQINANIIAPTTKYILIAPFVSLPIPSSKYRTSIGNLSLSMNFNMLLEEI